MSASRTIQLVYLARLRETFGTSGESFELPENVHTVEALVRALAARGGAWASELASGRAYRVAVNQAVAGPNAAVGAGDEVALFPPVTGG